MWHLLLPAHSNTPQYWWINPLVCCVLFLLEVCISTWAFRVTQWCMQQNMIKTAENRHNTQNPVLSLSELNMLVDLVCLKSDSGWTVEVYLNRGGSLWKIGCEPSAPCVARYEFVGTALPDEASSEICMQISRQLCENHVKGIAKTYKWLLHAKTWWTGPKQLDYSLLWRWHDCQRWWKPSTPRHMLMFDTHVNIPVNKPWGDNHV